MNIPKVHYGVLIGFLEVLDDGGGKSDVVSIASRQGLQLDDLLPILESGEMLGLIKVDSGDVALTEKGHLLIAASPKVKKKILRDMISDLEAFRKIIDLIKQSGKDSVTKQDIVDFLSKEDTLSASSQDPTGDFNWIIEWGRQALILKYDANSESVSLRTNKQTSQT